MNSIKTIKIILGIFAFSLISISCSKEDDNASQTPATIYPEENFLNEFKTKAMFTQADGVSNVDLPSYYESGIVFKPTVKGKINAINLKLPATNITRITIWNKVTQAIIATENIAVQSINVYAKKTLTTPIILDKDKEYVISFYSNDFYNLTKGSSILYPITSGNIVITDFIYGGTNPNAVAVFPNTSTSDQEFRDGFSFDFQRTE
ncbi:DUF4082 domain-containing protein [Flavobacterium sp.]|uniref:DUF4082 domain-containing protein n=1 Tax=Flavobacterium sp. TaxID=239 RepID=UPI00286C25AD|nr:DUF4082 domain-containing protein [Flavobacterium sp.]